VGGVAGVLALVGGIVFALWSRRRRQRQEEDGQTGVQRNTSTMSRSGLLRTEKEPQRPPPLVTSFNRRQSRNLDQDSISPISGSDRRNSRHLVDQRLNPSTIFVFDNASNVSVGSVDDSRDYHRPLNVCILHLALM
jgi:cell wall integrity and stress response component